VAGCDKLDSKTKRWGSLPNKLVADEITKTFLSNEKSKERIPILKDVSFSLNDGEIVSLIGPTGCGKTTLLRIIDGLIPPDSGRILINGREVRGTKDSPCAMVFQGFNLLPWRTAIKNVEFGLEAKGVPAEERRKTAQFYLELVGLRGYEKYHPHQLSGGMQQRVGLARAIAINPEIVLLDEPFSSVDLLLRESLREEVLRILIKTGKTAVFVTHNAEEALFVSDRIFSFSTKPAKIKNVYEVDLPRPKNSSSDTEILSIFEERKKLIESRSGEVYRLFQAMKHDLLDSLGASSKPMLEESFSPSSTKKITI
jgi:NitT/TauT family transport system ATP-binding protein